jgi:hypothetical protein
VCGAKYFNQDGSEYFNQEGIALEELARIISQFWEGLR